MEIKVNKEIRDYTESVFFGLSMRQFIFSALACVVAVLLYFLLRNHLGLETLSWVCILGAMFAVGMAIFRMPYIPLVSVLVAVTAFIPVVGAWIGCVLGAFFIFVDNPMLAVWFVVLFLIIQQIEGNLIYPKVVGNSIGLPGMWVLVAVSVGGALLGVAGMFLMIPFVSVLYTLLREVTNQRLSERPVCAEKLMHQPPELRYRLKEKRQLTKEKIAQKKSERANAKSKK